MIGVIVIGHASSETDLLRALLALETRDVRDQVILIDDTALPPIPPCDLDIAQFPPATLSLSSIKRLEQRIELPPLKGGYVPKPNQPAFSHGWLKDH